MKGLDRRSVLRGAGGITLALPFLNATAARARTRHHPFPTRFIVFFTANGTIHANWRPTGGETDFKFGSILQPIDPWRRKLIVLDGIAAKTRKFGPGGNGHDKGMGHMLTAQKLLVGPSGIGEFSHLPDGSAGGASIDQEIARRIGRGTRFPSLELGVRSRLDTKRQLTSRMCYRGPFQVVPPENDPAEAFRNLFAGVDRSKSGALARLRRDRRSVLDLVADDLRALGPGLDAEDRHKLESHLAGVREIERTLTAPPAHTHACRLPEIPEALDPWANDNYPAIGKLQMDLMAMALACDLTRVASLQWSTAQSGVRFSWLGQSQDHHGLSHMADDTDEARQQLTAIDHWYAEQFAYLLGRLSEVREGDETLLDHTVVMWCNEQGNGDRHTETDIPYLLAGSGNGALRTGRYLRFDRAAHNDLYVSMLHATGCDDVTSFGLREVCTGPLPGLGA
jgi:hypothetical protein